MKRRSEVRVRMIPVNLTQHLDTCWKRDTVCVRKPTLEAMTARQG